MNLQKDFYTITHKEITIYESVGFAALDIALAIKVYEKIKNRFLRK